MKNLVIIDESHLWPQKSEELPKTIAQVHVGTDTIIQNVHNPKNPPPHCKKCGKPKQERAVNKNGRIKISWKCQACHTRYVRAHRAKDPEKYREALRRHIERDPNLARSKRRRYVRKKTEELGASPTTIRSRKSEKEARARYERWEHSEDVLLLSGNHTHSELAVLLGRTLRGIERRKWRLLNT